MPGKTRLQNDLLCVEWDVKPYTLTHSASHSVWSAGSANHIVHNGASPSSVIIMPDEFVKNFLLSFTDSQETCLTLVINRCYVAVLYITWFDQIFMVVVYSLLYLMKLLKSIC